MMISPEVYIDGIKHKSFDELLKERESLLEKIREFEDAIGQPKNDKWLISPDPEVVYQCNLMYLAKLCELIQKTYNRVYVWGEIE